MGPSARPGGRRSPGPGGPKEPLPFSPGETLHYKVKWSIFDAGQITVTLEKDPQGPPNTWVINTKARSEGFVSVLYNVRDDFRSVLNSDTLCSRGISKQINEGRRHRIINITFDQARGVARLHERNLNKPHDPPKQDEHEIPACVEDVVSGFYYLRRQPLRVGDRIHLAVNDGSKTTPVVAVVRDREKIRTPMGPLNALRVEPTVFGTLSRKFKGKMTIWFSDDQSHYPLKIKARFYVGSITGTLTSLPGSRQPAASAAKARAANPPETQSRSPK